MTAVRNGIGLVTLTMGTAHPSGVNYVINAIGTVTSATANGVVCSVVRTLPTTSTQFRIQVRDTSSTQVDTDFYIQVI